MGENHIKYFACTSNYRFVEKFKLLSPISTKMPAGPDETDNHAPGAATEHTAKHASSKTETNASTHPLHARASQRATKSSSSMPNRVQLFPRSSMSNKRVLRRSVLLRPRS